MTLDKTTNGIIIRLRTYKRNILDNFTLEHIVSTWFWHISKCKLICVKYSLGQTWGYFGCGSLLPVTVTSKMKLHVFGVCGCIQDNRSKAVLHQPRQRQVYCNIVWWRIHAPVWSLRQVASPWISPHEAYVSHETMKVWRSAKCGSNSRFCRFRYSTAG